MNKAKFFEVMKECRVNASAHITIKGYDAGKTALVMNQADAPNAFLSMHKDGSDAMQKAWAKYELWLKEYFMIQDEESLSQQVEEVDHQEDINMMILKPEEIESLPESEKTKVINAFHRGALVMNEEIDQLSQELADRRCYWLSQQAIQTAQVKVMNAYKRRAFENGTRIVQHVVKVMVIARRLALQKTGYAEIAPDPTVLVDLNDCEIPF